jgi:hypothetical protein
MEHITREYHNTWKKVFSPEDGLGGAIIQAEFQDTPVSWTSTFR